MWMQTASGARFDLDDPKPEQVFSGDIIAALPFIPCFTGAQKKEHADYPYSVAQHCLLVARLVPPSLALDALLHDAWKVYVGDFTKPLNQLLNSISDNRYQEIRGRIQRVVAERFGVQYPLPDAVELADQIARATECRDILAPSEEKWSQELPKAAVEELMPLPSRYVRKLYQETWWRLGRSGDGGPL